MNKTNSGRFGIIASGVGIVEALVVTVIVALAAVAFLSLTENQNLFLRRTRQTNARDQLTTFLQGLVRDKSLLLFSARHPSNVKLRKCLGDADKKTEPDCDYGKQSPLYLVDLTDPTFQKVWTGPTEAPVLTMIRPKAVIRIFDRDNAVFKFRHSSKLFARTMPKIANAPNASS